MTRVDHGLHVGGEGGFERHRAASQGVAQMHGDGVQRLSIFQSELHSACCASGAACGQGQGGSCVFRPLPDANYVARTAGTRAIAVIGPQATAELQRVAVGIQ